MSKEAYLDESVLTLQDGWFIRLQRVSILCQHIGMVLTRLLNLVNHRHHDLCQLITQCMIRIWATPESTWKSLVWLS